MVYKFYGDMLSPPVRAVYFTIKMLNVEVEFIKVDLLSAENTTEKYLQVMTMKLCALIMTRYLSALFMVKKCFR